MGERDRREVKGTDEGGREERHNISRWLGLSRAKSPGMLALS